MKWNPLSPCFVEDPTVRVLPSTLDELNQADSALYQAARQRFRADLRTARESMGAEL